MTQNYLGTYAEHVYEIVKLETEGLDSIYRDYILELVGVFGLNALGVVNGRPLYVLL